MKINAEEVLRDYDRMLRAILIDVVRTAPCHDGIFFFLEQNEMLRASLVR